MLAILAVCFQECVIIISFEVVVHIYVLCCYNFHIFIIYVPGFYFEILDEN
jgi:hypothetical protein